MARVFLHESGQIWFYCPGCKTLHAINRSWQFNENVERPTFQPSVLVTGGHYAAGFKQGESCWCTYNQEKIAKGEEPSSFKCQRCHSFVTDGQIKFLDDCSHDLRNTTVDLPDMEEHMQAF